jgi:hypothetical protein
MLPFSLVAFRGHGKFQFTACEPTIYFVVVVRFFRRPFRGQKIMYRRCA